MEKYRGRDFNKKLFTYVLDAFEYGAVEAIDISKEFFESDGPALNHAD